GGAAALAHDERSLGLALAAARHPYRLGEIGVRVLVCGVDVARRRLDIETDAVVGEFGDLGLHTGVTPRVGPPEPSSNLSRAGTGVPPGRQGLYMAVATASAATSDGSSSGRAS